MRRAEEAGSHAVSERPFPEGYLGADSRISSGPASELVEAGYELEQADAHLLHRGLGLADLAHTLVLTEAGVVPPGDGRRLLAALLELLEVPWDAFPYDARYGDAYNSRERELERTLGPAAGWLHTGRTRREAGRIAFRLALRALLLDLHGAVAGFVAVTADRADEQAGAVWADTTYLQPAQPSTFGHYLAGFAEEATRHLRRLEAAYEWTDRSPAGVGGVGGTRIPLDRSRLSALLGFSGPAVHARDAMWAVDGLVDATAAAAQAVLTVDRLAEDLEIFSSPAFGYVALDTSLCRASVLLPQKRNPYALAVIRGGAGTLLGRLVGVLATQRTPSARTDNWLYAYGEVTAAIQLARRLVALGTEVVRTLAVDRHALAGAAGAGFTGAADLAEELVLRQGLDYRSAYRVVGRAVADALKGARVTLTATDLAEAAISVLGHPIRVQDDALASALDPARIVASRTGPGESAPGAVRHHCRALGARVADARSWNERGRARAARAETDLVATARKAAMPLTLVPAAC